LYCALLDPDQIVTGLFARHLKDTQRKNMYQRILVPVDGSATANKALVAALQMARDSNGQVHLVHVVEGLSPMAADPYGAYSGEVIEIMRKNGVKILDDAQGLAKAAGVEADTELFDNFGDRLAEVVADAAIRFKADLVVVGTHGRRGMGRLLLGSGAEQIIRLSQVPVLVIRGSDEKNSSET
jgi:nucleotide-binding universal stress UspA family protein